VQRVKFIVWRERFEPENFELHEYHGQEKEESLIQFPSGTPNFYGIEFAVLSVPIRVIRGS